MNSVIRNSEVSIRRSRGRRARWCAATALIGAGALLAGCGSATPTAACITAARTRADARCGAAMRRPTDVHVEDVVLLRPS